VTQVAKQQENQQDVRQDALRVTGRVISLDRGFPLVQTVRGQLRAQHGTELVKDRDERAAIGDLVDLECPPGQDIPLICAIHPRGHTLVRRSLVESRHEGAGKYTEQVLAANIDIVFVVCALSNRSIDGSYLMRQLVMAHESGAQPVIVLTKADLTRHRKEDIAAVRALAFDTPIIVASAVTGAGLPSIAALLQGGKIGVLLGRSGVGKSTLINELLGAPLLETGAVRKKDRAGRHTTVARKMVFLKGAETGGADALETGWGAETGGALIDAPGLRSIGLYDAHRGLAAAFPDITAYAAGCRYRDCTHTGEPDCAVRAAVETGALSAPRLTTYTEIAIEVNA
jgi:ribosome biogenesis GTPase